MIDAADAAAVVSAGAPTPRQTTTIDDVVPDPDSFADAGAARVRDAARSQYMGLKAGTPIRDIDVDTVFIGSCTNSRVEDLRAAADVVRGRTVQDGHAGARGARARCAVKAAAEAEGLDRVFTAAGFEWRGAGLLDVPGDEPRQARARRAVPRSTSNRNFEGRQGKGGRTHLVSPAVAAATAIAGHFAAPTDLD